MKSYSDYQLNLKFSLLMALLIASFDLLRQFHLCNLFYLLRDSNNIKIIVAI